MFSKFLIVSMIALTSFSSMAATSFIKPCSSLMSSKKISLVVVNNNVAQVRVMNRALRASASSIPSDRRSTYYNVVGFTTAMRVDNVILTGNGGILSLGGEEFSCL
jgi:hypothetical protein